MPEQHTNLPTPEELQKNLPGEDRHYESDPARYGQAMDLAQRFEDLPEGDEKDAIHRRAAQLYYGADMGDAEAIAYVMREHFPSIEDSVEK